MEKLAEEKEKQEKEIKKVIVKQREENNEN
jgi:hypothetical protein